MHSDREVFSKLSELSSIEKKKKLGQVFTPNVIADFMVSIIKDKLKPDHSILDPCIGPNTFLSKLKDLSFNPLIVGVEIDKTIITSDVEEFFNKKNRELILNNFLDYPVLNKFNFIIQNPPYVRQELMMDGLNSKEKALGSLGYDYSKKIPSQSNLYVYFLIKAMLHLKDNGIMVAVIYDSWLYSSFGKVLKDIFLEFGSIDKIYHFKNNIFPDAEVGSTVIQFCKKTKSPNKAYFIDYYSIDSFLNTPSLANLKPVSIAEHDFSSFIFNENSSIQFNTQLFISLKELSNQPIRRGIASIANGFFIHDTKKFKESLPFIKDVSKIDTYCSTLPTAYLLCVNGKTSKEVTLYLKKVKSKIESTENKYKAVKQKILKETDWYKIGLKKPGNFIFNYFLRDNIDFILNENQLYASDNFYILNIPMHVNIYLAIFNSTFTRLSVLKHSRNQGNGLRKIQLYEFIEIPIIDASKLSINAKKELDKLGLKLKNQNRYTTKKEQLIKKIDGVLLNEYNRILTSELSLDNLNEELKKYIN